MKRLFAIGICIAFALSLCGCNQPDGTFFYDESTPTSAAAVDSSLYREALERYFDLYYLSDPAALKDSAPAEVWESFESDSMAGYDKTAAYLKDNRLYEQSAFLTEAGENLSYTYAVTHVTVLSDTAVSSCAQTLKTRYGIDPEDVRKASLLTVDTSLTGKLAEVQENLTLTLVHIDNEWYVQNAFDSTLQTLSRNATYR